MHSNHQFEKSKHKPKRQHEEQAKDKANKPKRGKDKYCQV